MLWDKSAPGRQERVRPRDLTAQVKAPSPLALPQAHLPSEGQAEPTLTRGHAPEAGVPLPLREGKAKGRGGWTPSHALRSVEGKTPCVACSQPLAQARLDGGPSCASTSCATLDRFFRFWFPCL